MMASCPTGPLQPEDKWEALEGESALASSQSLLCAALKGARGYLHGDEQGVGGWVSDCGSPCQSVGDCPSSDPGRWED